MPRKVSANFKKNVAKIQPGGAVGAVRSVGRKLGKKAVGSPVVQELNRTIQRHSRNALTGATKSIRRNAAKARDYGIRTAQYYQNKR